ncbi:MAG: hypothetical protein RJA10_77 [Pseudomonadota bacterium]|jgi:DNA primase
MHLSGHPLAFRQRHRVAVGAALLACMAGAVAQSAPASGIYTCVDDKGRRLTSDRPIVECSAKEQQILNRDGSVRGVHPPVLTAEEKAAIDARERKASAERMAQMESVRRDKNLMARYRDEAAHRKAREASLESVRLAVKATEDRQKELKAERVPLDNEAEFYKGKRLPPKLKAAIEANDTAMEAQREAAANQQAEFDRVNRIYDSELNRLQKLWAGALPGSLGPLTVPPAKAPAGLAPAASR